VNIFTMLLLNYRTCEVFLLNNSEDLEPHIKQYNHTGDFVFGFGDGINTSLGIVGGVGGANSSAEFRILDFLMRKFTGAKAMVVQNYVAVKSQRETLEYEIKREEFEVEEYLEKEREEIEETYRAKAKEFEISLASSFLIGSKKAKLAKKIWVKGGIEMSVLGTGIPQLGYGIGADCIMQFC
jgi:VIT1/CCC1 family predicted Fe2+/Mn2+ transporter